MAAYLGYASARAGKKKDARRLLRVLKKRASDMYVPSDYFAVVHIGLEEFDEAFKSLERACRERAHHLVFLNADPMFDDIRMDDRFTEILQSVGLTRG
jgi:hypothetical protein